MEKAFREKKCISSKFELARFHQGTDVMSSSPGDLMNFRFVMTFFFLCLNEKGVSKSVLSLSLSDFA